MEAVSGYLNKSVVGRELLPGSPANGMSGRTLHIVFGIDDSYARGMGVAMTSLLKNNPDMDIVFHIFVSALAEIDRQRLSCLSEESGSRINLYHIDNDFYGNWPVSVHYSSAIYYRLVAPEVLRGVVERFLYLDADIICMGSLAELQAVDLEGKVAAVVSDHEEFSRKRSAELGLKHGKYFNSGVLCVDVERWNREGISGRAIEFLKNSQIRFWWGDQDILNMALDGEVKFLESKWNLLYDMGSMTEEISEYPILLHYTALLKPWHAVCRHPLRDIFRKYSAVSLWHDEPLEEPHQYDAMLTYARRLSAEKQFVAGAYWYGRCAFIRMRALWAGTGRRLKRDIGSLRQVFSN
jgi:lipopolysaccharide biosynthesis glycosyltransferase